MDIFHFNYFINVNVWLQWYFISISAFQKKKFFFEISNEQDNDKYETGLQIRLNQRVSKYHLKIIVGQLKWGGSLSFNIS